MKKLLLFDIDGTLLTSGGAGEKCLRLALESSFGLVDDFSTLEIAGRTDSGLAREILERHDLPVTAENCTRLLDAYLHNLRQEIPLQPRTLILPGILPLLDALQKLPNVVLALLTGNLVAGAEIKLAHYGVWDFFEFGAFADDHHDRNELGPFAQNRAHEKHGVIFPPERIYVIGDTPRDIDCGRAFGAKTVAVATGKFSKEELAAHRPDFLFTDLSDREAFITQLELDPVEP